MFPGAAALALQQLVGALLPQLPGAWESQPPRDDAVDFFPDDQLRERELFVLRQCGDRFVADAQEDAARDRFLVGFDLLFDVPLVLVLERSGRSMGHRI